MRQASRYTGQILVAAECHAQNMCVPMTVEESSEQPLISKYLCSFLISNFHRVLDVVFFLLGVLMPSGVNPNAFKYFT
jgi:hypothetical protein